MGRCSESLQERAELRSHAGYKAQNASLVDTDMSQTIRCLVGSNGIPRNVEPLTVMEHLQSSFHFASARRGAILIVATGDAVPGHPMRVDVVCTSSDGE